MARNKMDMPSAQEDLPQAPTGGQAIVGGSMIQGLDSIPKGEMDNPFPSERISAVYDPKKAGPPPRRFMLVKKGMMMEGNFRIELAEGKIIDDRNYDIKALQRVGIKLRELTDEDDN